MIYIFWCTQQVPVIVDSVLSWKPLTTDATPEEIAAALMATWYPNNELTTRPDLAIENDKWGICGKNQTSVCTQNFMTVRIEQHVYIHVCIVYTYQGDDDVYIDLVNISLFWDAVYWTSGPVQEYYCANGRSMATNDIGWHR